MPLFSAVFAKKPVFQNFSFVNVKATTSIAFFEKGYKSALAIRKVEISK